MTATESLRTFFVGRYKGFALHAVQRRGEWVGVVTRLRFIPSVRGTIKLNRHYTRWHRTLYGAVCAAKAAVWQSRRG